MALMFQWWLLRKTWEFPTLGVCCLLGGGSLYMEDPIVLGPYQVPLFFEKITTSSGRAFGSSRQPHGHVQ